MRVTFEPVDGTRPSTRRKDKALAATTALLVLSKQLQAIFHKRDEEE
jgi:hypothetical protein